MGLPKRALVLALSVCILTLALFALLPLVLACAESTPTQASAATAATVPGPPVPTTTSTTQTMLWQTLLLTPEGYSGLGEQGIAWSDGTYGWGQVYYSGWLPPTILPDIASSPYKAAIESLTAAGVIGGYPDGTFRPKETLLRAQFAKIVDGALGFTVTEDLTSPFVDLGPDDPADLYPHEFVAMSWMKDITHGTTGATFEPFRPVSTAQAISMAVRGVVGVIPGVLTDPPSVDVSAWGDLGPDHGWNVAAAEYNGLLSGLPLAELDPWGAMTREEAAQLLNNVRTFLSTQSTRPSPDPAITQGTAGDQDLICGIQSFWSGVDMFLPTSLPPGWRLLNEQDAGLWDECQDSNPSMGYQVMTLDKPGWYSVAYTNGTETVSLGVDGTGGSGGSRYFWERAESSTPISLSFEGRPWEEFRYSDDGGTDPDTLLLRLDSETSDGPWSPPNHVCVSFSSPAGRNIALLLAGSIVRIARDKPDEWVRVLVDRIGAQYQGGVFGEICLPSSLPLGWHVASLDEIARASGSTLKSNPAVFGKDEEDSGFDLWFSDGQDAVELGVNRHPLDVADVDQINEGELDVEFVGNRWRLPQPDQGNAVVRSIVWGGFPPYSVCSMTLTLWGDGEFSLETLVDFAQRMRAYSVNPTQQDAVGPFKTRSLK